ncbi:Stk1 family PASTA domain-containing Ser/Thr kinase [Anaerotardibacter muris]|uniref:Stk1 family PASTA domain-containing Ser/Thr kinase n=1 Tax=Anaerotardibacter muris TaxID=2941505 RepID=UPI00203AF5F3|nr:Stk1 family PASTA domain-containing Ser/Thr kinase [Anaerotardibacter muris]
MAGSMIGKTLNDRYQLTERVGIGGMAEVYRAHDAVLDRVVAVKVMLPQYAADQTFQQRFRQEAASAAKLQSPYIVSIYDWGLDADDETYYIVMEFLKGTDLKTAIKERGAINQRKAAEIGSQVAQALQVAHDGGIIHRDVKPQNIMIQPDGNIKVMDFGIARAGDAGLSQTATVLGTAHYISPEQAQGKELTGLSDVYSLGIVLYEATTGRLPFEGNDSVSVAVKQVNEMPPAPRSINPDIDPVLEAIIMKAIAKDPAERFDSAQAMRQALNDFLAGRPVPGLGVNSDKTQVIAGSIPPMNGTVAMPRTESSAQALGQTTAYRNNTTPPKQPPKSSKNKVIIGVVIAAIVAIIIGVLAFALGGNEERQIVPDVTNMSVGEAKTALEDAGFKIGAENQVFSSTIDEGLVVSTNPPGGQEAAKGTRIDLNISKGTEQVQVPDLKGQTKDEALRTLSTYGLNGQEGEAVFSDNVKEDCVAEQEQPSGSMLNKGDTVVFHLSKGAENIDVPNVVGASASNAESSLKSAGFQVKTSYRYSSDVSEGRVISQDPSGKAAKGSTITIYVSNGPEEATVPNVVDKSEADARSALDAAGFNVTIRTSHSAEVAKGLVISQDKLGKAEKGTTVTIVVSSGPA